jgi:hypothetical protein
MATSLVKLREITYLTFVKVNIVFIIGLVKEEVELHDFLVGSRATAPALDPATLAL